jgi:hypothetical protein
MPRNSAGTFSPETIRTFDGKTSIRSLKFCGDSILCRCSIAIYLVITSRTKAVTLSSLVMVAGFIVLAFAGGHPIPTAGQAGPPTKLKGLSDLVQFTPSEIQALEDGQTVSKLLPFHSDLEVAVAGAVWINAPVREGVQAMKDVEHLERGNGFLVTKSISNPPRLEDFSALELPEDDVKDLRKCHLGDCDVKLDQNAINRINMEIDWSKPTATDDLNRLMRQLALEYVTAYQHGGNKELAVYRNKKRPTSVAEEFASMIGEMRVLWQREPALHQYLLDYPKAQLPNATSFFYWHKVDFGLKPTIRINHVVITETPQRAIAATKQIYATHYFLTALEIRELTPDPSRDKGFWLVDVSRGRSASLAGTKGKLLRGRVEKESLKGLEEGMQATKSLLEGKTR